MRTNEARSAATARFTGDARGSFLLKGSNWFKRPLEKTEKVWKADIALLDEMHHVLRETVSRLSPRDLARTPRGKKVSNFDLLAGIAAHDLYHAGQIQLLKKLYGKNL